MWFAVIGQEEAGLVDMARSLGVPSSLMLASKRLQLMAIR